MCGTDLHIHDGGFFSKYPLTPGHEIVGRVDAVGEGVAGIAVGQRVAADNTVLCGYCSSCRRDEPLFCRNFYSLGVNGPGAFAEFVTVLAEKCFPGRRPGSEHCGDDRADCVRDPRNGRARPAAWLGRAVVRSRPDRTRAGSTARARWARPG